MSSSRNLSRIWKLGKRDVLRLAVVAALTCIVCVEFAPLTLAQTRNFSPGGGRPGAVTTAPEKERSRTNPFSGDAREVTAGEKLFARHCAVCHGEKAGGSHRAPSLLQNEVRDAPPGTLFWVVTNGVVRRGMPIWSNLPEPERWQIVTFLQSLTHQAQPAQK
jgi:cytochrome c oxidase cbb3-type subunit 2